MLVRRRERYEAVRWFAPGDSPDVISLAAYASRHELKGPVPYSDAVWVLATNGEIVRPGDVVLREVATGRLSVARGLDFKCDFEEA